MVQDDRILRRIKEMDKIVKDGTSTEYDKGYAQGKKERMNPCKLCQEEYCRNTDCNEEEIQEVPGR